MSGTATALIDKNFLASLLFSYDEIIDINKVSFFGVENKLKTYMVDFSSQKLQSGYNGMVCIIKEIDDLRFVRDVDV